MFPPYWNIVGQRDFNGDGKYDLLWRNSSGNAAIWLLNGLQVFTDRGLGNIPTAWAVCGASFDHLVGAGEQGRGNFEAESLRGP